MRLLPRRGSASPRPAGLAAPRPARDGSGRPKTLGEALSVAARGAGGDQEGDPAHAEAGRGRVAGT